MPGPFSKANRPKRAGAYTNWLAKQLQQVPAPLQGVVAVPFTSDWGPFKVATPVTSFQQFKQVYGDTLATPGYIAAKQTFQGEGIAGRGGAAQIVAYRTGGAAAAKATKILTNTTPVTALTLTAKYEGTRANNFSTQVVANVDGTKQDLIIYEGTTEVERYIHLKTDIAALAVVINATSSRVTAVSNVTGVALTIVGSSAMTGGNDGTTLANGDWTAAMSALDGQRFSVFAPYDLPSTGGNATLLAAVKAWVIDGNNKGKRFIAVLGGASAETITVATDATSGTAFLNAAYTDGIQYGDLFARFGMGTYTDSDLGTLSSSQLVPRIAGIIAACGETQSATFARLAGITATVSANDAEIATAIANGLLVTGRDSNATAPVRLEKGITAYVSTSTIKPQAVFGFIKYVRTMHAVEMEVTEWAESNVIGKLPVNDATREYLVGEAINILNRKVKNGSVQPAFTVEIDQDPPPSDSDEFIALVWEAAFARDVEALYNSIYVG